MKNASISDIINMSSFFYNNLLTIMDIIYIK